MSRLRFFSTLTISLLLFIVFFGCKNVPDTDPADEDTLEEELIEEKPVEEVPVEIEPFLTLLGTWLEVTDGTKLTFKVTNSYIAFQQPYFADHSITATYGSFKLSSYGGTNIKILDHND